MNCLRDMRAQSRGNRPTWQRTLRLVTHNGTTDQLFSWKTSTH